MAPLTKETPVDLKQIYVSLQSGSSAEPPIPVGTISFNRDKGVGLFQYLSHYNGPPLDPINLNYKRPMSREDKNRLSERVFFINAADDPGLLHQVFVDASSPGGVPRSPTDAELRATALDGIAHLRRPEHLRQRTSR
jgi:hypothetical protein